MATKRTRRSPPGPSRWLWILAGSFVALAAASIMYLVLRAGPASRLGAMEDWQAQLTARADDREVGIERFISDFISDARTVARYPTAVYVLTARRGPPYPFDPGAGPEAHLTELLDAFLTEHAYQAATVFDANGEPVASSAGAGETAAAERAALARSVASAGTPRVQLVPGSTARLLGAAPVHSDLGEIVGAFVLEQDPDDFLFRLLSRQPTPTRTGEALLVRRDGEDLEYLSPLRKVERAEGGLRLPAETDGMAAVAALEGGEPVGRYTDYNGDVILAAVRRIEGTDWGLVVKVDESEALADFRADLGRVVAAIAGLLLGALGMTFGLRRWQQQRFTSELLRERARFGALLDHASDPIFFVDSDLRILEANRRAEEFYGYSRRKLLGKHVSAFRPAGHKHEVEAVAAEAMASGSSLAEVEHVRANGERVPVEISTRTAELDGRKVMISIVRDIRERKEAEEALRKTEERYRTIVENSPDVIARFDPELRCVYVSPGPGGGAPFSATDPVGKRHAELGLPATTADALDAALRDVFETGRQRGLEVEVQEPDRDRFFDWRLVPELDAEGRVVTAVAIIRETTERHALETQLRQSQKMEAVGRLAGGVAHDFNNMLTSIQGHAELALETLSGSDPLRSDVREIVRSANRAAALTRQLLAFSRRQILAPQVVDLGDVVRSMESMIHRLIGAHIALEVAIRAETPTIRADPNQIEQVILNLAVNARDAMPGGGRLVIEVVGGRPEDAEEIEGSDNGIVRLIVSDSGRGISPESLDHIFEPFYTTKEAGEGTGLGLATVYGIVEQSGGRVRVESEPDKGTRFELSFPAAGVAAPAGEADARADAVPPARGELILVVEDEEGVRALAHRVLERRGYRVVSARNGAEALDAVASASRPFDLLLTDMVMPGMDGRELARRIRNGDPNCRVLLMSGYTEDAMIRRRTLEPGMGFIEKPFSPGELVSSVARLLAEARTRPA